MSTSDIFEALTMCWQRHRSFMKATFACTFDLRCIRKVFHPLCLLGSELVQAANFAGNYRVEVLYR